jgi:hypothetical protein
VTIYFLHIICIPIPSPNLIWIHISPKGRLNHVKSPSWPIYPESVWARVLTIVGVCKTSFSSSHLHIFTSSYPHIFSSSLIISRSHLRIIRYSHLHPCES